MNPIGDAMNDFDYTPNVFATTHLLEDFIEDYPAMLQGDSKELVAAQITRLELMGVETDNQESV